jgi:hypothetical protein
MMMVPAGVKVHLALGYTDMRKGLDGLAMLVQETLKQDPFSGHLFAFRGKKASMLKILFWDGNGLCLFTKNHLFAGSDGGGNRWAILCSLIETCKLNGVEPYAYLADVLQRMRDGHSVNRLDELLPWNWKAGKSVKS